MNTMWNDLISMCNFSMVRISSISVFFLHYYYIGAHAIPVLWMGKIVNVRIGVGTNDQQIFHIHHIAKTDIHLTKSGSVVSLFLDSIFFLLIFLWFWEDRNLVPEKLIFGRNIKTTWSRAPMENIHLRWFFFVCKFDCC